jgi:hypothetical protein
MIKITIHLIIRIIIAIIFVIVCFLIFVGCENKALNIENIENPIKTDLLKNKLWYNSINDIIPIRTSNYQYDKYKRLERINHYYKNTDSLLEYESFYYNHNDNIETRLGYSYANDSIDWVLRDSTSYKYDGSKLILEDTFYPSPNSYNVTYQYEYNNSKITKKTRYDKQEFVWCTVYNYMNNVCIQETCYADYNLSVLWHYTIHYYDKDLLLKTENYTSNNEMIQIITYTYDNSGNIITEESKKTEFEVVKPVEYVYRYEY